MAEGDYRVIVWEWFYLGGSFAFSWSKVSGSGVSGNEVSGSEVSGNEVSAARPVPGLRVPPLLIAYQQRASFWGVEGREYVG